MFYKVKLAKSVKISYSIDRALENEVLATQENYKIVEREFL